jgi:hypothetical protein
MFVGISAGGWLGWWLGAFVNLTFAIILSGVFSVAGVFAVRWLEREYFE